MEQILGFSVQFYLLPVYDYYDNISLLCKQHATSVCRHWFIHLIIHRR